jgi:hypothetical protein
MPKKTKKQPLVWKLEWDVLAVIDNPDAPPLAIYKGDANRLFGQHNIPRNWSVTLAVKGALPSGEIVRRAYSYKPDGKLFLAALMTAVQQHVDAEVWDECAGLDVQSITALAVTKRAG